ncbi:MAG: hypothetical protein EA362_03585 [Saprospirales bacterium]|nr:MAG: hypothetical protein EA362_03585 [Saprospirales bacterium]
MKASIIVALLLVAIPLVAIYVVMDLRADTFPVGTIFHALVMILCVSIVLFFNHRSKKKKKSNYTNKFIEP